MFIVCFDILFSSILVFNIGAEYLLFLAGYIITTILLIKNDYHDSKILNHCTDKKMIMSESL